MKTGPSTLVAILLTGLAATAAQAQPQVVVQDKLPAGAAETPSTAPSPDVLTQSREAVEKAAREANYRHLNADLLAEDPADADVILRVPIRITAFDMSRIRKTTEAASVPSTSDVRVACLVSYSGTSPPNDPAQIVGFKQLRVYLTPLITNGALDMVQEFGLHLRSWRPDAVGFKNVRYECRLNVGSIYEQKQLCLFNAAGAGNVCEVTGQVPGTF